MENDISAFGKCIPHSKKSDFSTEYVISRKKVKYMIRLNKSDFFTFFPKYSLPNTGNPISASLKQISLCKGNLAAHLANAF